MFDIEFNPKGWSLLDEQLAESGLEMHLFETLSRWISGDDPNKRARRAEAKQQRELDAEYEAIHQHNLANHEANKSNYLAERDFAHETAVTNWEYSKKLQDFTYAKDLATYHKSKDIRDQRLDYNQTASTIATSEEVDSIQDIRLSHAFQREAMHTDLVSEIKRGGIKKFEQSVQLSGIKNNRRANIGSIQQELNTLNKQNTFDKEAKLIEGLQKSGRAALGQAGVSRKKTLQSTAADTFRSLVELDSTLSGARNKAGVDLLKILVDSSLKETQIGLNLEAIELGINEAKEEVKYNNRILDANMNSATTQMERNIQQINLQKIGADLQAEADMNLFPEKFGYRPEPKITPERTFITPRKQEAPTVPKGPRVSTGWDAAFDIVGEVAEVATMVMGISGGGGAKSGGGGGGSPLVSDLWNSTAA